MEVFVGRYMYKTKLHLIRMKSVLKCDYTRDHFDYITSDDVKITQDGLLYIHRKISSYAQIKPLVKKLQKYVDKIENFDEQYLDDILRKKRPTIIIKDGKSAFTKLERKFDYTISGKYFTKSYGEGLVVFNDVKLSAQKFKDVVEHQIIFSEYQDDVNFLLDYNKKIWQKVEELRRKKKFKFKDLPKIIDYLIELRENITLILKKINKFDEFLLHRKQKCKVKKELEDIKLYDFDEMIWLNSYLYDHYDMTKNFIVSTINMVEFIYKENEQKELNILQVIFAIGTIAAVVALGAMPGARIFLEISGQNIVGKMVSFNTESLIFWTIISVVVGVVLFVLLNYAFMHAKKLKIVELIKHKKI